MEPWREELYHSELYHFGIKGMKWKKRKKISLNSYQDVRNNKLYSIGHPVKAVKAIRRSIKKRDSIGRAKVAATKAFVKGKADYDKKTAKVLNTFGLQTKRAALTVSANPKLRTAAKNAETKKKLMKHKVKAVDTKQKGYADKNKKIEEGRNFVKEVSKKYNLRKSKKRKA